MLYSDILFKQNHFRVISIIVLSFTNATTINPWEIKFVVLNRNFAHFCLTLCFGCYLCKCIVVLCKINKPFSEILFFKINFMVVFIADNSEP